MCKINLNALAKELKEVPLAKQKKIVGGNGSIVSLPEVVVTASYPDNEWDDDFWEALGPSVPDENQDRNDDSGTPNEDNTVNPLNENVNDKDQILDQYKSNLDAQIGVLEDMKLNQELLDQLGYTIEDVDSRLEDLKDSKDVLDLMEKSENNYRIEYKESDGDSKNDADFSYDKDTNEYVISIEQFDTSLLAHELTHVQQFENGDISFDEYGNSTGYSLEDEVEAYNNQHDMAYGMNSDKVDLNGNPVESGDYEVTGEDVLNAFPGLYDNLPKTDAEASSSASSSASASAQ